MTTIAGVLRLPLHHALEVPRGKLGGLTDDLGGEPFRFVLRVTCGVVSICIHPSHLRSLLIITLFAFISGGEGRLEFRFSVLVLLLLNDV